MFPIAFGVVFLYLSVGNLQNTPTDCSAGSCENHLKIYAKNYRFASPQMETKRTSGALTSGRQRRGRGNRWRLRIYEMSPFKYPAACKLTYLNCILAYESKIQAARHIKDKAQQNCVSQMRRQQKTDGS